VDHDWGKVKRFEQEFALFVGAEDALAVSSCTAALHLSLLALGIGPGDGVITSPLTFCSGVHVIEHVGARPVFADVEPGTLGLDPAGLEPAIRRAKREFGARVKAIIAVHLYGHPCDLDALQQVAVDHNLAIIEDAAHCLPGKYKGRMIGSMYRSAIVPWFTCFSFYATKNLTTAEGGMLIANEEWLEMARRWALHGLDRDAWKRYGPEGSWGYEVLCPGFKYNLTDIQAALGMHQLRKLPDFHARRRQIAHRYNTAFARCRALELPVEHEDIEHAWHIYALRLKTDQLTISRNQFIDQLRSRNIGASVHFIPAHLHAFYRKKYGNRPDDFPIAYGAYQRLVSLPLFPGMQDQDVDDVVETVTELLDAGASAPGLHIPDPVPSQAEISPDVSTGPAIAKILRRSFDVTCAMLLLFLLAPLFAVIALLIKLNNGGPVFYLQPRVGKNFKIFSVLKFRTMVRGADQKGLLTPGHDSRVTRVGRFLRKFRLDELPQLINVLKGEMHLVGARPEVERYVSLFREQYALLLCDAPGMTDPATLAFRHEADLFKAETIEEQYVSEILPRKLELSLDYSRKRCFASDALVLFRTILALVN